MTNEQPARASSIPIRTQLLLIVPAVLVGIASAFVLIVASAAANVLETVLWDRIPAAFGLTGDEPLWIFGVLTAVGLATGFILTFVPGHAGPDPATTGLAEPPQPLFVLPGIALALILTLGGGVSLGPENPIIVINLSLAVALGLRIIPGIPGQAWAGFAFSGTIGAMFGTPIAAALLLSEALSEGEGPLWDRMFAPLVAAGAGAVTMLVLEGESFALTVEPYPAVHALDLLTGSLVAVGSAVVGMVAVYLFPRAYALFGRARSPLLIALAGGAVLGVLGAIGGPISLFKGLDEMKDLAENAGSYTAAALAGLVVIKLLAVLVAGTSGFRGGRIFPSVFVAVALGLAVHAALPDVVPEAVALSCALIGVLVAVTRSGWLALFMAALMVGHPELLPLLCIAILPAWLVVSGRPEMVVAPRTAPSRTEAATAAA